MTQKSTPKRRRHADFQNAYRRSSNFPTLVEKETKELKIKGSGTLKLKKKNTPKTDA